MRFASLGSGSAGNATLIGYQKTYLLLDCGFGPKEIQMRLARLGLQPDQLTGILITHEHEDHASGAFKLAAKFNIPIWLTYGTLKMCQRYQREGMTLQLHEVDAHSAFEIQDIQIHPYPVPHDAREPVQFVFSDSSKRFGVLTDTGCSTPHIERMLTQCDGLMLECNHDLFMLENGPYSAALKKRVGGRLGHLDNHSAAQLLSRLDNRRLKHLVAAHLSAKNNTPVLARNALSQVMDCAPDWIGIADQANGIEWRDL